VGEVSFWCALIGFYVTFVPLYVAGLLGMTRRMMPSMHQMMQMQR
jgi:cytochrome o ubiquinol oxidase subunit I